MRPVDKLYEWLQTGPTPVCDQILGDGLEYAEAEYFDRIRETLIARATEPAWTALLSHYDKLVVADQQRVIADAKKTRASLTLILRGGSPQARINALTILQQRPSLKLSSLLVDLLRDEDTRVNRAAAAALRRVAEVRMDQLLFATPVTTALDEDFSDDAQLVRALREVVRGFELHCRMGVLEAALWFARGLGDGLWSKLNDRKSSVGRIVAENLELWGTPRMAPMLLECLTEKNWRQLSRDILMKWDQPEHLIALLRNSDLLSDPEIRKHLHGVKRPPWFANVDDMLLDLPEELRGKAPEWVTLAGYPDPERVGILARWCASDQQELQRSAVQALLLVDHPDARQALNEIQKLHTEVGDLVALVNAAPRSARPERGAQSAAGGALEYDGSDFPAFWRMCTRHALREGAELIDLIRRHVTRWRPRLSAASESTDPRERILLLRIIATSRIAPQFRDCVELLRYDAIDGIRKLANDLAASIAASQDEHPGTTYTRLPERWPGLDSPHDRQSYDELVERLLDPTTPAAQTQPLIADLCDLLTRCEARMVDPSHIPARRIS